MTDDEIAVYTCVTRWFWTWDIEADEVRFYVGLRDVAEDLEPCRHCGIWFTPGVPVWRLDDPDDSAFCDLCSEVPEGWDAIATARAHPHEVPRELRVKQLRVKYGWRVDRWLDGE